LIVTEIAFGNFIMSFWFKPN